MENIMNNGMSVTPEMLEKINKAHAVSSGIMNQFKAEEPVAAALAKFNPVSQDTHKSNTSNTNSRAKSSGSKNGLK
jgi:hypothetical protein